MRANLRLVTGADSPFPEPSADRPARGVLPDLRGVDCEQTVFDLHNTLLIARSRRLALEARLAALGIRIDPDTGAVRLTGRMTGR